MVGLIASICQRLGRKRAHIDELTKAIALYRDHVALLQEHRKLIEQKHGVDIEVLLTALAKEKRTPGTM
jgi:hypothetical protein